MSKLSKIFFSLFLLASLIFTGVFSLNTVALEPTLPDTSKAENIFLYNTNTDKIIYSKNLNKKIFPGSAVKIMTGLIICERFYDSLDEQITITQEMIDSSTGWNIKLKAGMTVSIENLLYGLLCGGGNDATIALAIHCSGSVDRFVDDMNAKASALKMKNTYFTNPTGIDDPLMYSTAADVLILAKEAYKNDLYLDISSAMSYVYTPKGTSEEIKFFNRNALISNFYAIGYRNLNAYGMISGNTTSGGYCTVTYSEKNGTGYLCATMNASADDDNIYSYSIINSLLDFAFDNYSYIQIAKKDEFICTVDTRFALPDNNSNAKIKCVIMDDVYTLTYKDINVETDLDYRYYLYSDVLDAPIENGIIIGGVDILYGNEVIGNAFLVTDDEIASSGILIGLNNLKIFFTGRFFLISLCIAIISLLIYKRIELMLLRKGNRKSKNYSKRFY